MNLIQADDGLEQVGSCKKPTTNFTEVLLAHADNMEKRCSARSYNVTSRCGYFRLYLSISTTYTIALPPLNHYLSSYRDLLYVSPDWLLECYVRYGLSRAEDRRINFSYED